MKYLLTLQVSRYNPQSLTIFGIHVTLYITNQSRYIPTKKKTFICTSSFAVTRVAVAVTSLAKF